MEALQKRTGLRRVIRRCRHRSRCNCDYLPQYKCNLFSRIQSASVITYTMAQSPQSHKYPSECGRQPKCPYTAGKTCCDSCHKCSFGQRHAKHIFKNSDSAEKSLRWKGVSDRDTGHATIKAARIQARAIVAAAMLTVLGGIVSTMILVLFG